MNWQKLLNTSRLSGENDSTPSPRTPFQRDYDRVIYSGAFRRLADKTQVFPLPTDDHVHSRLTHSLEVSSVGRSLGTLVAQHLREQGTSVAPCDPRDVGDCVAAACLAHDLGNPPFGHAGEDAIQEFFSDKKSEAWFLSLAPAEQLDLLHFEGNAHALRLATSRLGKYAPHGLDLTVATLGVLAKYPCTSDAAERPAGPRKSLSKHGINQAELGAFRHAATDLGLKVGATSAPSWVRHPLAFIAEAADDVAYQIIDLEDGLRIGCVSPKLFHELTEPLWAGEPRSPDETHAPNDRPSLLDYAGRVRAVAINRLLHEIADTFVAHLGGILGGTFDETLVENIPSKAIFKAIREANIRHCYTALDVVKLELAGAAAIAGILEALTEAVLKPDRLRSEKLRVLLPPLGGPVLDYGLLTKIVEHVAGMTDGYAVQFYRELSGIRLPGGRG